jgi:hypothetical protein
MWTGRGSPRVTRVLLLWPTVRGTQGRLHPPPQPGLVDGLGTQMAKDMHGRASTEPVHSGTGQGVGAVRRSKSCGARVSTLVECPFCAKDIEVRVQSEFVAHADRCRPT